VRGRDAAGDPGGLGGLVTLTLTDPSPQTHEAYKLKQAWVESTATWNVYASAKRWEKAEAKRSLD
jgi:hypothetical protein